MKQSPIALRRTIKMRGSPLCISFVPPGGCGRYHRRALEGGDHSPAPRQGPIELCPAGWLQISCAQAWPFFGKACVMCEADRASRGVRSQCATGYRQRTNRAARRLWRMHDALADAIAVHVRGTSTVKRHPARC